MGGKKKKRKKKENLMSYQRDRSTSINRYMNRFDQGLAFGSGLKMLSSCKPPQSLDRSLSHLEASIIGDTMQMDIVVIVFFIY